MVLAQLYVVKPENGGVQNVSIPLWFSLNSLYYKNYTGLRGAKSNLLAKIGYLII